MRRLTRGLCAIGDDAQRSLSGMGPNQAAAVVATALTFCLALGIVPACGSSDPKKAAVPRHLYGDGGQPGDGSSGQAATARAGNSPDGMDGGASGGLAGAGDEANGAASDGGNSGAATGGEGGGNELDADGCGPATKNCERSNPDCETDVDTVTSCGACDVSCEQVHGKPTCEALKCVVKPGACDATFGDCDQDGTNGCETPLTTDPNNCGTCGRSCEGGTPCTNGMCAAVAYATASAALTDRPYFTAGRIFFSVANRGIGFVARDGTALPLTATEKDSSGPITLTGDADYVYWLRNTSPATIRKLATNAEGEVLKVNDNVGATYNGFDLLRSNATALFFSWEVGYTAPYEIRTIAKTSSGTPAVLVTGRAHITQLIIAPDHLVWSEQTGVGLDDLYAAPLSGGTGTDIKHIAPMRRPDDIYTANLQFDGTYLYWSDAAHGTGAIERFRLGAPAAVVEDVAFDLDAPHHEVIDEKYVYYLVKTSVYRVRKDGSALPELVTANTNMEWLTFVDDKYIWGVSGAILYRTPK
jgi:hypothetical protein